MSPDELAAGHHWVWREAYRLPSMIKRMTCSRSFLKAALVTNYAYRRYAKKLPRYTTEVMEQDHQL
jgi:hypothetical protein